MHVIGLCSLSDHPLAGRLGEHLLAEAIATGDRAVSLVDLTADDAAASPGAEDADAPARRHGAVDAYKDIVAGLNGHGTEAVLLTLPSFVLVERHPVLSIVDLVAVHVSAGQAPQVPAGFAADTLALLHKDHFFVMSGAPNEDERLAALALRLAEHGRICTTIVPETRSVLERLRAGIGRAGADGTPTGAVRALWRYCLAHLPAGATGPAGPDGDCPGAAAATGPADAPLRLENIVVTYGDTRTACFALDISTTGMAFVSDLNVRHGDRLAVDIPGVGRLIGKVRYREGYRIGIQFVVPGREHLKAVLGLSNMLFPQRLADA